MEAHLAQRRFDRFVSTLVLAAVSLLAGVGMGLHDWFGCSHGCHAPQAPGRVVWAVEPEHETQPATGWRAAPDHCELCDLLAQFRAVEPAPPTAPPTPTLRPAGASARVAAPLGTPCLWPAPRGPPVLVG